MQHNYWIKDTNRQEIITKTKILNEANFNLYASYFNLMDAKGLVLELQEISQFEVGKIYKKSDFYYLVLNLKNRHELYIMPNEKLVDLTHYIVDDLINCKSEHQLLNKIFQKMEII